MPFSSMFRSGSKRRENEQPAPQGGMYPYNQQTPSPVYQVPQSGHFSNQRNASPVYQTPQVPSSRPMPPLPPVPPRERAPSEAYAHSQARGGAPRSPQQPIIYSTPPIQQSPSPAPPDHLSPPPTTSARAPSPQTNPTSRSSITYAAAQDPGPPPDATPRFIPSPRPTAKHGATPGAKTAAKRDPPKVRKILSLDGGGIRGLSIIKILKYIMQEVNRERGMELDPIDPWQEFDMIGGTSTGGILAIMLGRLRMSLDECESAYSMLAETIFTPVHNPANPVRLYKFLNAKGKFSSTPLEDCIKSTIWSKEMSEQELLKNQDPDACRVFVCATRAEDHSLAILRSYKTRRHDSLYEICKIWEAARATSAASTFFEPIEIGPSRQKFVDGALTGRNNPIRTANTESRDVWPREERLILSIGTGAAPGQAVTGNLISLVERLKEIVTDSEQTNKDFRMENNDMVRNGRLYRFNVLHGLADVGLEEHQAKNRVATYTDRYLDDPDVFDMVQDCVNNLNLGGQRLGIRPEEEGLSRSEHS
ncbi:hypothetical protein ACLMJK_007056 [Lecanora helva]